MNASNEKEMDETAGETGNVSGILEATSLKREVVGWEWEGSNISQLDAIKRGNDMTVHSNLLFDMLQGPSLAHVETICKTQLYQQINKSNTQW